MPGGISLCTKLIKFEGTLASQFSWIVISSGGAMAVHAAQSISNSAVLCDFTDAIGDIDQPFALVSGEL